MKKLKMSKPKLKVYGAGNFRWNDDFEVVDVKDYRDAELIAFPGGADVHPRSYGHKISKSYVSENYYDNDQNLFKIMDYAVKHGIPMWGNCRGAQLLGVYAGMTLVQHVSHPSNHLVTTYTGEKLMINSIHHQNLNAYDPREGYSPKFEILMWAENLSHQHIGQFGQEIEFPEKAIKEIEGIFLPEINAMACQNHAEWGGFCSKGYEFIKKEIRDKIKFV
jgi:hypothetical protein